MPTTDPPPTFPQCVLACWDNADFMREYRRLTGAAIGEDKRSALDRLIDAATGHTPPVFDDRELEAFFEFVHDYIWSPLVAEHLRGLYVSPR